MSKLWKSYSYWIASLVILLMFALTGIGIDSVVSTISNNTMSHMQRTVVIDPGHGGEDGGTTSCSGILESHLNLEIAFRLRDLMQLLGTSTVMIRESDISVYTAGNSLSEKKVSDLRQRVRMIENTPNAILISIHQNHYPDPRYSGAQVFYAASKGSKELAELIQENFKKSINKSSKRNVKEGRGIYILEKIISPGVLVECGFLSNPEEDAKIHDAKYQMDICCVIVSAYFQYISQNATIT